MPLDHRILKDNNGTLVDYTTQLNNVSADTVTLDWVAAEDKLYIASKHPFNSRYFEIGTANSNSATLSAIEVWDGTTWQAVVDKIDETSSSGVTLARSGNVVWIPNRDQGWTYDDTEDMGTPLSSSTIYELYWARFTFSANLSAGTTLNYVGQRFANDDQLAAIYPELGLSDAKTQWEAGKTNWNEQLVLASDMVVRDLAFKKVLWHRNQVLDIDIFRDVAVHKCAQIIFTAWGNSYERDRDEARRRYDEALNKVANYRVDRDSDGRLDFNEMVTKGIVRRR